LHRAQRRFALTASPWTPAAKHSTSSFEYGRFGRAGAAPPHRGDARSNAQDPAWGVAWRPAYRTIIAHQFIDRVPTHEL
ncbi:MAG TPA: hypothetical protein VFZ61_00730, partial [Polyangiales bacterium]